MKEWKPSKWAMWLVIASFAGLLGMWVFRHYTVNGLAQLIGIAISSGVMAVVSMIRSETIRWQDSHMRRIDNTIKALDFYNENVRDLVITFMRDFDTAMEKVSRSKEKHGLSKVVAQIQTDVAIAFNIAKVLHRLDQLGWLLRQAGYFDANELFYATASELANFLLESRYQQVIQTILKKSSLRNLGYLMNQLQEAKDHGRI